MSGIKPSKFHLLNFSTSEVESPEHMERICTQRTRLFIVHFESLLWTYKNDEIILLEAHIENLWVFRKLSENRF